MKSISLGIDLRWKWMAKDCDRPDLPNGGRPWWRFFVMKPKQSIEDKRWVSQKGTEWKYFDENLFVPFLGGDHWTNSLYQRIGNSDRWIQIFSWDREMTEYRNTTRKEEKRIRGNIRYFRDKHIPWCDAHKKLHVIPDLLICLWNEQLHRAGLKQEKLK
jgi:hypothetical protein